MKGEIRLRGDRSIVLSDTCLELEICVQNFKYAPQVELLVQPIKVLIYILFSTFFLSKNGSISTNQIILRPKQALKRSKQVIKSLSTHFHLNINTTSLALYTIHVVIQNSIYFKNILNETLSAEKSDFLELFFVQILAHCVWALNILGRDIRTIKPL